MIQLQHFYNTAHELLRNEQASLHDVGDGVLCFEIHSKGNTLAAPVYELGLAAVERLNQDAHYKAMLVGNQGKDFSLGANIGAFLQMTQHGAQAVQPLQEMTMQFRFSPKPVVVAAHGRALGGGAEVAMAGAHVVATQPFRAGLVELGVGVIPAGGGCKELLRRKLSPHVLGNANVLPYLLNIFETVANATFSDDATHAQALGFVETHATLLPSAEGLLDHAKKWALLLSESHRAPIRSQARVYALGQQALAVLHTQIEHEHAQNLISEYEADLRKKLAVVLCGGSLPTPQWVSEDAVLELERTVFAELLTQPKTQARISHMLAQGKPLKN